MGDTLDYFDTHLVLARAFLAAALKWGEEAIEKFWSLYHIVA